ncbi:MAG: exodeoxyribonuclease VII small subunit [Kiritimatiellae bacterium]|jgi:exodeoxyribonuclease VII small subunit|nr:exodeoxyribonuclease VII small subunit [Kiritimatiellia bacterium]
MSEEKKSFEDSLKRLDKIVQDMESGEMELDAMISAFEEGQRLVKSCSEKLNEVEKKIEKVVKGADGQIATEPFESESDA